MQAWINYIYRIFIATILCGNISYGQIAFPDGVYYNLEQLRTKQPAFDAPLLMKPYRERFLMRSYIDSIDRKFIRENILAYVKNDSVFIRAKGRKLSEAEVFSLALTKGDFITYFSPYPEDESSISPGDFTAGAVMAATTVPTAFATGAYSSYFILSLRTGNVRPLSIPYIENRLNELLPDQLIRFHEEPSKTLAVFLKYINFINKELETNQKKTQ